MLNGQIISDGELSGKLVKNEELFNHEYLYNRNAADAHPIQAITGLKEKLAELENKAPTEFKSIKAEISRLITNILNESTRAQASEKQIQAEVNSLAKALLAVQNDEELEKIALDIIKLKTENLELKNELVEAINKVSEGLVEQISLLQDLSNAVDARVTNLTEADIELKETFSEKFINTEASISENTNNIIEIEKKVAGQEAALDELKAELETLSNNPETPSNDFLDSLIKTFVTTEDIATVEQNIASLKNRITDLESSINGEDGVLSRLDVLETQATVVYTLAENIQSLSEDVSSSKIKVAINEDNIKANKENLQNIQLKTESNIADISAVKSEIESLKTITESLEKSVNTNKVNIEELSDAQAQLAELQTDIIELRSELILKIQSEAALLDISLDKVSAYITTFDTLILPDIQKNIQVLTEEITDIKNSTEKANNLAEQLSKSLDTLQGDFEGDLNSLRVYIDQKYQEARREMLAKNSGQQSAIDGIKLSLQELTKSDKIFSASIDDLISITEQHSLDLSSLETIIGNSNTPGTLSYQAEKNSIDISVNRGNIAQLADKVIDLAENDKLINSSISSVRDKNVAQDRKLTYLDNKLTELQTAIFGNEEDLSNDGLNADVKDLQNQLNNMSSVFRFVGIIDTATTVTSEDGKPLYLRLNSNSAINKVTLKDSIYNSNNPYEAHPGDVVLVERFDKQSGQSLGYAEFVFINTTTHKDWEEIGNIQVLDSQLQHHIDKAINDNNAYKEAMNEQFEDLRQDITHHIAKDFETRSLIFPDKESAEAYAQGMDPERFPPPGGDGSEDLLANRTNAYPGLIITVVTDGIYESYIIKEDRSLTLISGGGGSGSPDKITDTQYCVQELSGRTLNITNVTLDTFKNALSDSAEIDETIEVIKITIDKPERKNNKIMTYRTLSPGGYIYYISKLENLKFTSSGFDAGFTRLDGISLDGYYVYRTNQKLIEPVEITIN